MVDWDVPSYGRDKNSHWTETRGSQCLSVPDSDGPLFKCYKIFRE